MPTRIVPTAKARPGKCLLTGETQGPFLDTGRVIPRYGRVYISIKRLGEHLEKMGYYTEEDVAELKGTNLSLTSQVNELTRAKEHLDELIEAVTPYLPKVEPEIIRKSVSVLRAPSDDEIADWIQRNGASHPVVKSAQLPDKGSTEEWQALYGQKGPQQRPKMRPPKPGEVKQVEIKPEVADDGPDKFFEIHDQKINLDDVLEQNVTEVLAYADGKTDEFKRALVRREFHVKGGSPRKGVLLPLGYWDEDEDESIYPMDVDDMVITDDNGEEE